ncbi:hypothetical protein PIB30_041244 [Stylosanthes scabra]|uniref:Uncharacterized protein n=1 Tax=Stylosanthes scabra TaxID=79078 RepID=A0ABU6TFM2_9FABA|nr:hypothetical protein [Stylosanthes scabra]
MPRSPRYSKKSNLATSSQQPHEEAPVASSSQHDDPLIPSTCGDEEEVNLLANDLDPFDDNVDRSFEATNGGNIRGRRNPKPWTVHVIAMKPLHGTKVVLQFNTLMQPIGNSGGLLSGVLRVETFYFDYQNGTIKGYMLKSLGKSWKEARNRLFHNYYDPRKTLEQNVNARPRKIDEDHWRRFLRYRLRLDTKENMKNARKTQQTDQSSYTPTHAVPKPWRGGEMRSQLFGRNSQQTGEGTQAQETQRMLEELRAKLTAEKLKRQAVESEVASEKVKRQLMENALRYLIQKQGGNLPADIIAGRNSLEGQF